MQPTGPTPRAQQYPEWLIAKQPNPKREGLERDVVAPGPES